ncbi:hypothetical protein [Alicyclobacillus suci]|uniref:hypothetical protein n=1 Tax=Alicyclobacillus suci TaxID=2816080 RepID=UPI001A8FB158|nr:hypothetical protein [Alicyclobacillus suci]
MNAKIEAINNLSFSDWSCSGGECEYVLVDDTPEHRKILVDAGFTEDELNVPEVSYDDGTLNVAHLAFKSGAEWFNPQLQMFGLEDNMRLSGRMN